MLQDRRHFPQTSSAANLHAETSLLRRIFHPEPSCDHVAIVCITSLIVCAAPASIGMKKNGPGEYEHRLDQPASQAR